MGEGSKFHNFANYPCLRNDECDARIALWARSRSVAVTMVTSVKDIHSQMLSITYRMCSSTACGCDSVEQSQ